MTALTHMPVIAAVGTGRPPATTAAGTGRPPATTALSHRRPVPRRHRATESHHPPQAKDQFSATTDSSQPHPTLWGRPPPSPGPAAAGCALSLQEALATRLAYALRCALAASGRAGGTAFLPGKAFPGWNPWPEQTRRRTGPLAGFTGELHASAGTQRRGSADERVPTTELPFAGRRTTSSPPYESTGVLYISELHAQRDFASEVLGHAGVVRRARPVPGVPAGPLPLAWPGRAGTTNGHFARAGASLG